jgi:hypothetical protein
MEELFRLLASPKGEMERVVAGFGLTAVGLLWLPGVAGWILAAVGLVPLLAGSLGYSAFVPLFSVPSNGIQLRRTLNKTEQAWAHER